MAFHQYNTLQYNVSQYNADSFAWVVRLSDSVGSSDAIGDHRALKALADTIASSELAIKYMTVLKADFVFLSDSASKSISNKGLSESIRINDWLQISRSGSQWS